MRTTSPMPISLSRADSTCASLALLSFLKTMVVLANFSSVIDPATTGLWACRLAAERVSARAIEWNDFNLNWIVMANKIKIKI